MGRLLHIKITTCCEILMNIPLFMTAESGFIPSNSLNENFRKTWGICEDLNDYNSAFSSDHLQSNFLYFYV